MILISPKDPVIHKMAEEVDSTTIMELESTISKMIEIMNENNGIGLAAPQVGISKRFFIMKSGTDVEVFINPEIIFEGEEISPMNEGCLTLPEQYVEIFRPDEVLVEFTTMENKRIQKSFQGIESKVVQHELDHLNGIIISDSLSKIKKDIMIRKVEKIRRRK